MRVGMVLLIALLILALIGGCMALVLNMGQEVDRSSPKATVIAAIKAIPSRDVDKIVQYFTPTPGGQMSARLRSLYEDYDDIKLENIWVVLVVEVGINARVSASYDLVVSAKGHENRQHFDATIKLINDDGKWYINEAF